MAVPARIQELIGGLDGADLEKYGQYTKLVKGDLEVFILPPKTCVVLKKRPEQDKIMLFPNYSIAAHNVGLHHDNDLMQVRREIT